MTKDSLPYVDAINILFPLSETLHLMVLYGVYKGRADRIVQRWILLCNSSKRACPSIGSSVCFSSLTPSAHDLNVFTLLFCLGKHELATCQPGYAILREGGTDFSLEVKAVKWNKEARLLHAAGLGTSAPFQITYL